MSRRRAERRSVFDPCRLVRQVKQVDKIDGGGRFSFLLFDPCRLVRQVKQVGQLENGAALFFFLSSTPAASCGR